MKNNILKLLILISITSCASKPVLYPNGKYENVGEKIAQEDIDKCMVKADKFLKSSKGKQIVKSAGSGAFVGAAMGIVSGLIFGDVKRAVTSGAAVGGVAGAAGGAISPDQLKQAYTNKCLRDQGYEIVGWD